MARIVIHNHLPARDERKRMFPTQTLAQLKQTLASNSWPEKRAQIEEEVAAREAGTSVARVTPQIAPGWTNGMPSRGGGRDAMELYDINQRVGVLTGGRYEAGTIVGRAESSGRGEHYYDVKLAGGLKENVPQSKIKTRVVRDSDLPDPARVSVVREGPSEYWVGVNLDTHAEGPYDDRASALSAAQEMKRKLERRHPGRKVALV